jgi:hypothetical protein
MREMDFTVIVSYLTDVTIKIDDEKLFAEKYNEHILENGLVLYYDDLFGQRFQNCLEIIEVDSGIYDENIDEYNDNICEFLEFLED